MTEASSLAVEVDGRALAAEDARAVWERFSAWMDDHRGDLAGFARREGWKSVRPEHRSGRAVLVASTRDAAPAKAAGRGGAKGGGRPGRRR